MQIRKLEGGEQENVVFLFHSSDLIIRLKPRILHVQHIRLHLHVNNAVNHLTGVSSHVWTDVGGVTLGTVTMVTPQEAAGVCGSGEQNLKLHLLQNPLIQLDLCV